MKQPTEIKKSDFDLLREYHCAVLKVLNQVTWVHRRSGKNLALKIEEVNRLLREQGKELTIEEIGL